MYAMLQAARAPGADLMHLMHWFELWVSQETAAHAAYMSCGSLCGASVAGACVSESAACCALVSVVTGGWGGVGSLVA